MKRLANLPNISSDSNLTKIKKYYDKIESHARCLDSRNVKSDSYSALLVPMTMGKLPPQLKLVVSRNLRSELWGLAKALNLINTKIKARVTVVSMISVRVMNLIIWTCGLPLRWHFKLGKVFLTSVFLVWDNIGQINVRDDQY